MSARLRVAACLVARLVSCASTAPASVPRQRQVVDAGFDMVGYLDELPPPTPLAWVEPRAGSEAGDSVWHADPPDVVWKVDVADSPVETGTDGECSEVTVWCPHPGAEMPGGRGRLDAGRVRAVVSGSRAAFQACYLDFVARRDRRSVDARVRFVVQHDGRARPIDVCLSVEDAPLAECIERIFESLEFPEPEGGRARVFYPVQLSL